MAKKPRRMTDQERGKIERLLKEGKSQTSVAKQFQRSKNTVSIIAKQAGLRPTDIGFPASMPEAMEASRQYNKKRRLDLLNRYFDKAASLLDVVEDPQDFKHLTIALGVLIDKRRLEEGQSTENIAVAEVHDELESRLAAIVERRRSARRTIDVFPGTNPGHTA